MKYKHPIRSALFAISLAACLAPSSGRAQGVWNNDDDRDYNGTPPMLGTPLWSYGYVAPTQSNSGHVGNWGGIVYPGSGGVTSAVLGAPANTNCDVNVSLSALTLTANGQLNMLGSSGLTVTSTDIQQDGTLANTGVSGGIPFFTNAGTFRKSAGTGVYTIDGDIIFNSLPGSVIQVDSGSLQLPGINGLIDGTTFNTAAGTVIDLVSINTANEGSTGETRFRGTIANTTGVGTVRLSANQLSDDYISGQSLTFNFPGTVFQWTGGTMGANAAYSVPRFYNVGTMNLSGDNDKTSYVIMTNQGQMTHGGNGNLIIANNTVTNAAGATYDLQSDAGFVTGYGQSGQFSNAGLFKKSAGTGTSTVTSFFNYLGGTIEVDSGTLQMPTASRSTPDPTSTGANFVVAANAVLDLGQGSPITGTFTGSGVGTVRFASGLIPIDLTNDENPLIFNFTGSLFQWTGGTIGDEPYELFTNAGTINLSGAGGVAIVASMTNSGTMIQTGAGSFNDGGGASFTNTAGALFDLRSDAGITRQGGNPAFPFTNAGTLQKSAGTGTSSVSSTFTNNGTVAALTGTLDFNGAQPGVSDGTLPSGTWTVADGAALTFSYYPNGVTVNQAEVTLSGPNSSFPPINALADNQGTFSLLALRQFTTAGNLSNEGTITLDAGSTLHVAGNFTASDAAASDTGAVGRASGKHTQAATASKIHFTLGGTAAQGAQSPGVLQTAGTAKMAGLMEIALAELAATPGPSDTLTVLAAKSVTGSFDNAPSGTRLPTTDGRGSFLVTYGPTSISLSQFLAAGQSASTPTVTIAVVGDGDAVEGGENGKVAVRRTGDLTKALTVRYKVAGGVVAGKDYKPLPDVATIPAGAAQVKVKIKAVDDSTHGGTRIAKVKLKTATDGSYTLGSPAAAKVKIIDND